MKDENKDSAEKKEDTTEKQISYTGADVKSDLVMLTSYKHLKLTLANQLRIIHQGMAALGSDMGEKQCHDLMVKLAEDRFTLAVLGQFNRGKSTLMNAILGRDLLPSGILPLTSVITLLRYGPSERLLVNYPHSPFPDELPITDLLNFVTEKGNPGNKKMVKSVYAEMPVPFLQKGVEFVDTPGIGSSIAGNTAVTYDFLPECDAVLFVTSADNPLSQTEIIFLKEIKEFVHRIFFVVNKMDLIQEYERDEVLTFISETIKSQTDNDKVHLFPVSSKMALEARLSANETLYVQSGLKTLEDGLVTFLSKEKTNTFLAAIIKKALKMLSDQNDHGLFNEAAISARYKAIGEDKSQAYLGDPHDVIQKIRIAQGKLEELCKEISGNSVTKAEDTRIKSTFSSNIIFEQDAISESKPVIPLKQLMLKKEDSTRYFQNKGCPVCKYLISRSWDFYSHFQYLLASEEQAQQEFAEELGFCSLHTWQLMAISSPYGASIGYASLAERMADQLKEIQQKHLGGKEVEGLLRHANNCRVCRLLRQSEQESILQIHDMLESGANDIYSQSQGLCLRHLGRLLDSGISAGTKDFILSHSIHLFEQDAEDMRSYAMKRDALKRDLLNTNEKTAYRRAIIRIMGERNMMMPWDEDGEI